MAGETESVFEHFEVLKSCEKPAVLVLGGTKFMGKAFVGEMLGKARICVVNRGKTYWAADPFADQVARVRADRDDGAEFAQRVAEATRRLGGEWDCVVDFSGFSGHDVEAALKGLGGAFQLYVYISSDSIYEVSSWAYEKWKPRRSAHGSYETSVCEHSGARPENQEQQDFLNNSDSYGHEKLQGEERLVQGLPAGRRCLVLRLPDVIGPFDSTHRLWAYWHWLRAGEVGAPPPQIQSYKRKRKMFDSEGLEISQAAGDCQLAVVYSSDVAKFLARFILQPPNDKSMEVINLCCDEQLQLSEFLERLFLAAGGDRKRPRLAPDKNPKLYLPSVDRPWPLSCERAKKEYGFQATPLDDVLAACVDFFEDSCVKFPEEAKKAALKLPSEPAAHALKLLEASFSLANHACCLASTGPQELCTRLIEWMLQRPPAAAGAPDLLEITEVQYASSLEMACRNLPSNIASEAAAERLLNLAMQVPRAFHNHSAAAKAKILRAATHVMSGDTRRLCEVLGQHVLPGLCVSAQDQSATSWLALRMVLAILHSLLEASKYQVHDSHPVVLLWRDYSPCLAKAKSQVKWSERQKVRVERLLSFSVVQQWRAVGQSCSVDAVNWDDVDSVVYVAGGSGGVLLVRFNGTPGQLLCVKPQRLEARGELLASLLADALEIRTARLHILPVSEEILSRLRRAKLEIGDHQLHVEKKILADAKYLGLVEFVQGPIMEGEDFVGHFRNREDFVERFWLQAGRLAAFDCLINNLDRLPLIWENDGNLKNLMMDFPEGKLSVVGIDQAVRGIRSEIGLAKYLCSLQELLRAVWGADDAWLRSNFFQRICSAIEVNFQGEFLVHAVSFKRGLQQAFRRFAWHWSCDLRRSLDESVEKVAAVFSCHEDELKLLKGLVQAAATTITEEVQKLEMYIVPKHMADSFRKLLPRGLFGRDQLTLLLHLLDSKLEMSQAKEFLDRFFPGDEDISCADFLQLLFGAQ
eukprot:s637_g23.t2